MDAWFILEKLTETEKLIESVPEKRKQEARTAVLAALLLKEKPSNSNPLQISGSSVLPEVASDLTSLRQVARITKKKGITGDRVVLALACYIKNAEERSVTTNDCRHHWQVLSDKTFATNWVLIAESKSWLIPVEGNGHGERGWEVTRKGWSEWLAMQTQSEKKKDDQLKGGVAVAR